VRRSAAKALGEISDPAAVPALVEVLGDSVERVRTNVAQALGEIGDPAAVPTLVEALGDSRWEVRQYTAQALGKIGDSTAVPVLVKVLGDSAWRVRQHAALALGKIGDPAAVPALVGVLDAEAQTLVMDNGDDRGQGELERRMERKERKRQHDIVRRSAILALGRIGNPEVINVLQFLLEHQDKNVRQAAQSALEEIEARQEEAEQTSPPQDRAVDHEAASDDDLADTVTATLDALDGILETPVGENDNTEEE
jgi:HEAT repeat protein